ncbi:type II CAAX endopeptidase family protein [Clostridium sp.]|jgi:membrane protease YdiL (CAAX protease family)|uniref:CPBP family intramembrane glutamic endopeptidase n=1 Tax=Clostridium sp. TaxID=1506 RepID=UPI0025B86B57|nr:type II CAAX endopeptidase family protein [Clostridium sp.]MCI9069477.1 CPBP family intramembrane metalloprotease [Clostridium sp.]
MELKIKEENKKVFNRIGLAMLVSMILVNVIQIIFFNIIGTVNQDLLSASWINYIALAISYYLIGFPVFYFMIKGLPEGEKREDKKLGVWEIVKFCFISYSLMYIFNFLTNIFIILISIFKGSEVVNPLQNIIEGSSLILTLIFVGILSPIIEEMMFRGIMLNKLRRYGDKVAIVTTALLFGLFHANFSQFFYATVLGLIFAYVTLKTGTIKYSIIFHIFVNMMGSFIIPLIIGDGSNLVAYGCVLFLVLLISIVGLVLLIKDRKNISLLDGEVKLEKGTAFKTIWINLGMILFTVICLVSMIAVLFI